MNQKVILLAAVVIALLGIGGYYLAVKDNNSDLSGDLNMPPQDETANWKTCVNAKYKYEAKYPSDWKVWTSGVGDARLATCEESLDVIIFSPNIYANQASQINIDVSDKARMDGTIYAGATSIDDYFARNPSILQARPKIKETTINGEKLVWLKDNTMLVFHKGSLFEFRAQNVNEEILLNFFSSFKFLN